MKHNVVPVGGVFTAWAYIFSIKAGLQNQLNRQIRGFFFRYPCMYVLAVFQSPVHNQF